MDTLLHAMAGDDEFLFDVARKALLSGPRNDVDTILYRQDIVKDCLKSPAVVRELYDLTGETIEERRGSGGACPVTTQIQCSTVPSMPGVDVGMLRKLRGIAEETADRFESAAFKRYLPCSGRNWATSTWPASRLI